MRNGRHDPTPAEWEAAFRVKAVSALRIAAANWAAHPNSAASRAYYAVHNAMNMKCGPIHRLPRDHGLLASASVLAQVGLDAGDRTLIEDLARFRRISDYETRAVYPDNARRCVEIAEGLLRRLGVGVSS